MCANVLRPWPHLDPLNDASSGPQMALYMSDSPGGDRCCVPRCASDRCEKKEPVRARACVCIVVKTADTQSESCLVYASPHVL